MILAQADLHRELLQWEGRQIRERITATTDRVRSHQWWLLGGAAVVGLVLTRGGGGFLRWLPLAATAWRVARDLTGGSARTR
jgi:hypothetical protein